MANNEEQNIVEKANEVKKAAEETAKLAANISSGNFIGAAKNALNLLKNKQFRKALKRKLIMFALQAMIPIIIAVCFFSLLTSVKDKLVDFLSGAGNSISTFFSKTWEWLTESNWIELDKELDYTTINGETKKATIVDQYIYELSELGISLKDLRLLGEADYSNVEELLEDKDNKELVEKYIAEFIRADIITQQPHKTDGTAVVNPNNQNQIDGGVYFYRTKKEPSITEKEITNDIKENQELEVTDKDYKQMTYIDPEEFMNMANNNDKNIRYKYSIDKDTGELLLAEIKTTTVLPNQDVSNIIGQWFSSVDEWLSQYGLAGETTYEVTVKRENYKEYISKYTMPYEFLINLCTITQNPEFVYHVALLARGSKIILAVQDNTTIERETVELEEDYQYFKNSSSSSTSGATQGETTTNKKRTVTTTTVQTPVLRVEYADTWSFYDEAEYTKNVDTKRQETGVIPRNVQIPDTLPNYHEAIEPTYDEVTSTIIDPGRSEYWDGTFLVKTRTNTQTITKTTTYNEPILESVEKSKQFLGLLRNSTGKCEFDCYEEVAWRRQTPEAAYCAKYAEFDRNGINVQYRIPNMTRTESPLNKLLSGLDMLYATLQSNSSGYKEDKLISDEQITESYEIQEQYIADEDYESAYVVKMQGLVDHLRYLMTFPENESYTIKDLLLDTLFGDNEEEYVPEYTWNGTTTELIEMLGNYAHEDMQESGILASVTVAQALLESGWGKSQLSATYNNYFGIKKGSGWDGPTVTLPTKEVINGQTITIKAEFRVYESPLESLKNHSRILSASRYSGVKGETDYRKAITIIKNGGYATDPGYVNKICKVIEQYGLTRFD